MNSMSIIKPISIKLLKRYTDIVKAYMDVKDVLNELRAVVKMKKCYIHGSCKLRL